MKIYFAWDVHRISLVVGAITSLANGVVEDEAKVCETEMLH